MSRPREFEPDTVRERTLHTFLREGYAETSLATLEEATGVGRRSLYNSFGDKRAQFLTALGDFRSYAAGRFLAPLEAADGGLNGIRETFDRLLETADAPIGRYGCLICNTAREPIADDPEVRRHIDDYYARVERSFATALTQAQAAGALSPDRNVERLAAFCLSILISLCTMARAGIPKDTLVRTVDETMEHLARDTAG